MFYWKAENILCSLNPLDNNPVRLLCSSSGRGCEHALPVTTEEKLMKGLLAKGWAGLGDPCRGTQDSWWPVTAGAGSTSGPELLLEPWLALQQTRGEGRHTPFSLSCRWLPLAESSLSQRQESSGAGVLRGLPVGCRGRWRVDQVQGQCGGEWRTSGTGIGGKMYVS